MATLCKDVFLCHASEDKATVVGPLYDALTASRISCWYDEAEIKWGDSITRKVNEGLKTSRFAVIVLSIASLRKNWQQRELHALLNLEAADGSVRVLPILVGSDDDVGKIAQEIPLISDKLYLRWNGDSAPVVQALMDRLGRKCNTCGNGPAPRAVASAHNVYVPSVQRRFSQRDKDVFIRETFVAVSQHFEAGLEAIATRYRDVDVEFSPINAAKFEATIYLGGDVKNRCRVRIGGPSASSSIAYIEGCILPPSDNAMNDWLSVTDTGSALALSPSGLRLGRPQNDVQGGFSPEEAADYLWRRFVEPLER